MSPRLLDLFAGAGGCSVGYARAGFEVMGVDIEDQPNYPFEFIQAGALELLDAGLRTGMICGVWRLDDFDAVSASPPCQAYTKAQKLQGKRHPDLIAPVRRLLEATGLPYVIENVPGAPLIDPVVLDGAMFDGLRTERERWFETNWPLVPPNGGMRYPRPAPLAKMGRRPKEHEWMHVVGNFSDVEAGRRAMGIDWMTRDELSEAIPPAYTAFIGEQLMQHLTAERAATFAPVLTSADNASATSSGGSRPVTQKDAP